MLEGVVAAVIVRRAPAIDGRQFVAEAKIDHAGHVGHALGIASDLRVQAFDVETPKPQNPAIYVGELKLLNNQRGVPEIK